MQPWEGEALKFGGEVGKFGWEAPLQLWT